MNDYYSQYEQPEPSIRAKNALDVMPKDLTAPFSLDELEKIALDVVSVSKNYSLTGYGMFGKAEEVNRLRNVLETKVHELGFMECF